MNAKNHTTKSDNISGEPSKENSNPNFLFSDFHDQTIDYIIPVEGSLGIFALGAKGLKEWRKIRNIHQTIQKPKTNDQSQITNDQ